MTENDWQSQIQHISDLREQMANVKKDIKTIKEDLSQLKTQHSDEWKELEKILRPLKDHLIREEERMRLMQPWLRGAIGMIFIITGSAVIQLGSLITKLMRLD